MRPAIPLIMRALSNMAWACPIRGALALLPLMALCGCTPPTAPAGPETKTALCDAIGGHDALSITLAFGLSIPGGQIIPDAEWADFLARTVTPLFPAGLSVTEVQGQWQNGPTMPVIHEPARLVWILAPQSPTLASSLTAIREAYKKRFNQNAVAAFIHSGCASF